MPPLAADGVVVLVREGCHLCVEAVATIATVCDELGVTWGSIDVDSDPELRRSYTDHVPVTFVAGREHARWFVDADELRAAISSRD